MEDYRDEDPEAVSEDAEMAAEFARLMGMTVQDILRDGQKALFADLVGKVRSGKANHQEKAILRNILKDNGLTLGIPPDKPEEPRGPAMDLPDFEDPAYE